MSSLTTTNQGFAPANLTEAMAFSEMLAKSTMIPKAYQGKPEDVIVAVQWGKELGLAPLQALQNIACINGKPSVYGDAAMALVQNSNVCEGIEEYFEGEGTVNPVAVCIAHRKNRTPVTAKFSVEDAKRAGLWGKTGPWQNYPKRMLQMRARGFALRDAFPDVLKGLITVEEASDYPVETTKPAPRAVLRNPLDAIGKERHPAEALPVPESPIVMLNELDTVNAKLAEASQVDTETGEVDPPPETAPMTMSMVADSSELKEPPPETVDDTPPETTPAASSAGEWALHIPGKDNSIFPDQQSWSAAYEALAEKVYRAIKIPTREKMTKLRELREANEDMMQLLDALERIQHTAAYSKRLAALGAKLGEEGGK